MPRKQLGCLDLSLSLVLVQRRRGALAGRSFGLRQDSMGQRRGQVHGGVDTCNEIASPTYMRGTN